MKRATLLLLVAGLLVPAAPAFASCAFDERTLPQQIDEAEIVFLGTVIETSNRGRTAEFQVEEAWKGGPLESRVTVYGGPEDAQVGTSVDRTFEVSVRYLVFPLRDGSRLTDNSCSPTREYTEDMAQHRPAGLTAPTDDDPDQPVSSDENPGSTPSPNEPPAGPPDGAEPAFGDPAGFEGAAGRGPEPQRAILTAALVGSALLIAAALAFGFWRTLRRGGN